MTTESSNASATTTAPLYVQFARKLMEKCKEMGLEPLTAGTETGFPQNEGYFFVRFGDANSAAMIVPKSKVRMGNVHLHIDAHGLEGHVQLPKKNGKVICHFLPDVDLIAKHVLPRLPGASKRVTQYASPKASATPVLAIVPPPVGTATTFSEEAFEEEARGYLAAASQE